MIWYEMKVWRNQSYGKKGKQKAKQCDTGEGTRNGSHEVLLHCPGRNQAITDTCPVAPH